MNLKKFCFRCSMGIMAVLCIVFMAVIMCLIISWPGKLVKLQSGTNSGILKKENIFTSLEIESIYWEELLGDEGRRRIFPPTPTFRILQGTINVPSNECQRIEKEYQWEQIDNTASLSSEYCEGFFVRDNYEVDSFLFSKDFQHEMTKNSYFAGGYIFYDKTRKCFVFWLRTL